MDPDTVETLQQKKTAVQEDTIKVLLRPQRRAHTPTLDDIKALENHTANPEASGADKYASAVLRFMAGSSSRFNDIMHTQISTMRLTTNTIEFTAWQTKTTGILKNQRPMPLIAPLHTFTGVQWWTTIEKTVKKFTETPGFHNMDYLLPCPTRDRQGFCPRPCNNSQALRWLRTIRSLHAGDTEHIQRLTLPSLRVWMADLAYQSGISRDQRRYIGRWASESTADTYTREHRQVICNIWQEVLAKLDTSTPGVSKPVPEDLNNKHWDLHVLTPALPISASAASGADMNQPDDQEMDITNVPTEEALSEHHTDEEWVNLTQNTPAAPRAETSLTYDSLPHNLGGPLTPIVTTTKTGPQKTFKAHLLTIEAKRIGCSWQPKPEKFTLLTIEDYAKMEDLELCRFCFRKFHFPRNWTRSILPHHMSCKLFKFVTE